MKVVLIVEDNDKNMKLARDVLQAKGYATIEAVNGEDGVRFARERDPDLVLMDIRLPGISGIEALAALRADPKTSSIPVVRLPPPSPRPTAPASRRPDSTPSSPSRWSCASSSRP